MRFGVLGPVELWADGRPVPIGPPKQRAVLALLVLHANRTVPVDEITDALWGDDPPRTAQKNIQVYVWRLRKLIGDRLESRPPGYRVTAKVDEVDLTRFEQLMTRARAARRAGELNRAAADYAAADALWRGDPLADVRGIGQLHNFAARLDHCRLTVTEEQLDVGLRLGRHAELLPRLESLVAAHPLHEHFTGQLMTALCQSGRRAEAYAVYQRCCSTLARELGVEPGPALRRLAASTAAARALTPFPVRQLPPTVDTFTDRVSELEIIRDRLVGPWRRQRPGQGRVAVLVIGGSAGVGKSALAIQAAHQLADDFPDGQLYVNLHGSTAGLSPVPPIAVLGRFLRLLGVPADAVPADLDEATARLRSILAERRMLVVLDNAADAAQVRPLLPSGPGCAVLVTARRTLAELTCASHLDLGTLTEAAAGALLARIAGAARVAAEPRSAAQLVHWSGGLPLAVWIIGARLAVRPTWCLGTLVGRLADERRRLAELRLGDATLRTSFLVSYQSLRHPLARRLFRLLGVLDGPDVALPVAAAAADQPVGVVRDAVEELVDARLLDEDTPDRYRMHDLVRLFARERADAEESGEARIQAFRRAIERYLTTAERTVRSVVAAAPAPAAIAGSADRDAALAWLEAERANLVAAVAQAAQVDDERSTRAAVRLASTLFPYFEAGGHVQDWVTVDRLGCELAHRLPDLAAEAGLLGDLAAGYFYMHRLTEATDCLRRSLPLWRAVGCPGGEARALNLLGIFYGESKDYQSAARYLNESLVLRKHAGDLAGQASTLGNIGTVHALARRYPEAIRCFQTSARLARRAGAPAVEANALGNLGEAYCRIGRYPAALRYLRRSLTVHRAVGNERSRASALGALAEAYQGLGDLDRAVRYAERTVRAYLAADFRHGEAVARRRLGLLLRQRADPDRAAEQLRHAYELFAALGAPDAAELRTLLSQQPDATA